ncbi:MAG: GerAB/ArcD/ProY family transporter, partial [Firmicutes bacterium]|nr:GerAB/ArcD/ProY family transporter [Bacillota bacterium]
MPEGKTGIGPWLYWSLLIVVTLSFGLINITFYATKVMGANGYLTVPIALVLAIPPLWAAYQVMKRYPALNLLQAGLEITGPVCGRLFGLAYLTILLLVLALFLRGRINLINTYLLSNTPLPVLMVIYLFSAAYLASRGIETISRLASFVLLPILTVLVLLAVGALPEIDLNRLRPVFHPDLKLYLPGGLSVLYAFAPLGVFAMISPYLRGIQRKIPR